jgi:hypothetical protein
MTREAERRSSRRIGTGEAGIVTAHVRPGHPATVVDVSARGVLIESSKGLRPGATVDLLFNTAYRRSTLRGQVVRCAVVQLRSSAVSYRAAIAFDDGSCWPVDECTAGYAVPALERPASRRERVDLTPDLV